MDPLSITASVLTILGAGSAVGSGFKKVLALRTAPTALMALNNEVNDMHRTVGEIDNLLRRDPSRSGSPSASNLAEKLETTKDIALEIEKFIAYIIPIVAADGRSTRIDRTRLLRSGARLQELKAKIQSNKTDLLLEISVFTSSVAIDSSVTSYAILRRIEEIDRGVKESFQNVMEHHEQFGAMLTFSSHQRHGHLLPAPATSQDDQKTGEDNDQESLSDTESVIDVSSQEMSCPASDDAVDSAPALPSTDNPFLISTVTPGSCSLDCECTCHKNRRLRSPQFLERLMGSLFVGYRSRPVFTSPCNAPDCQANSTQITYTYAFPQWFLKGVLYTSMSFDRSRGPELILRVMRVRPLNASIFYTILWDSSDMALATVKRLIDCKEASVLDVDSDGNTVLLHAVNSGLWSVAKFLLQSGADVFYTNRLSQSPHACAWEIVLARSPDAYTARLSTLFPPLDAALFEFPPLHRALLDLSGLSLEAALAATDRSHIDSTDAYGRTALMWAARRGEHRALSRLLECGADPNQQDAHQRTALHWAADNNHVECVKSLLLAKALPDHTNSNGITPLMLAAAKRHASATLEVLLAHGATIDARDRSGDTALMHSIPNHVAENAGVLIRRGADVNLRNEFGQSAVYYAIQFNSHDALQMLLGCDELQLVGDEEADSFLDFAALYGDGGTLHILISAMDKLDLGGDERQKMVDSALDDAKWRVEENQEGRFPDPKIRLDEDPAAWFELFKELASSIVNWSEDGSDWGTITDNSEAGDDADSNNGQESSDEEEEWQDAPESGKG